MAWQARLFTTIRAWSRPTKKTVKYERTDKDFEEKMTDKFSKRKVLPHDRPSWICEDAIFFITVCCEPREENQLCHEAVASKLFETVEFRQNRGEWYVHLLLMMPDHVHGLISFPTDKSMRKIIQDWKESVARRVGVKWQRDFFDHRLRNDENFVEKADYIRMNPVRKGLVEESDKWPYVWPKNEPPR